MTLGAVPTTKETSATVKETPSWVTEMTPSWQVMGGGKREFHRANGAKAAKSQRDAMTIAQPFMAGSGVNKMKKSREGRQKNRVGCPHWWPCATGGRPQWWACAMVGVRKHLSSLTGLWTIAANESQP
jgi:hypothetical protein